VLVDLRLHQLLRALAQYLGLNMTIKDKAKKVVVGEVIEKIVTPADLVKDRVIELIKESSKTIVIVIFIIGFIVWLLV